MTVDGERHDADRLLGGRRQLEGLRRRDVRPAPRRARRRPARRADLQARPPSSRFLRELPKVFKGAHLDSPHVEFLRGEVVEVALGPPVRHLRRRRPDRRHARHDDRGAALPARDRPGLMYRPARAARPGRAGGQPAARAHAAAPPRPGRLLLRARPRRRCARMASELDDGLGARLGHQRQDHHLGDDRRVPGARPGEPVVHNRAGLEHGAGAWPRRCSTPAASRASSASSRSTRPGCRRSPSDAASRALLLLSQPVPRPARPLRRAGAARRPLGRAGGAPGRAAPSFVLNADDPLVADLGPRPRGRRPTSASRTTPRRCPELQHAADSKHCRNCGAAYVYDADLPRPPGPLPLPQLRPRAARCRRWRRRAWRSTGCAGRASRCAPRRDRSTCASPSPASTTSTTPSAAAATALELGVPLATVGAALEGFGGAFGRVETIPIGGRRAVDPAGQEPGRRERGAAHADARGRRARPLAGAERPHRRRARRLLDLGRRLRGARRPGAARDLLRHARRGDGAAPEVRGHRRRARGGPRPGALARLRGRGGPRASGCTRCPPTRRCSSCATCSRGAAWRGGGRSERRGDLARRRVRRLRRRPAALARAGRAGRRARARPRRRHRPRGAGSGRRRHDVTALDSDAELLAELERARRASAGLARRAASRPTPARSATLGDASRS